MEQFFVFGMAAAAICDLRYRRVPNWLNVGLFATGLASVWILGGWRGAGLGVVGAGLSLALLLLPFRAGWVAGGDVKLAVAIGAWLGPVGALWTVLFGLAGGGVLAAGLLLTGGSRLRAEVAENLRMTLYVRRVPDLPRRERSLMVPLALALGMAAVGVLVAQGGLHA